MAIPASGTLTLQQIATEFGGTQPISLNQYYRGGSLVPNIPANIAVPTSGLITMGNFYGTTHAFVFTPTIASNTANYNLGTAATAAGWDGVLPIISTITINSGIYVYSSTTATAAFIVPTLPAGSTVLVNNSGAISGMGGAGGIGGDYNFSGCYGTAGASGADGGPAIQIAYNTTINNYGTVAGGGGGGGGGGSTSFGSPGGAVSAGGGGGGGGACFVNSGGGARGCYRYYSLWPDAPGTDGGTGTWSGGGGGGAAGMNNGNYGGTGGSGGFLGTAGNAGGGGNQGSGAAGAAGRAVYATAGTITFATLGTVYGAY